MFHILPRISKLIRYSNKWRIHLKFHAKKGWSWDNTNCVLLRASNREIVFFKCLLTRRSTTANPVKYCRNLNKTFCTPCIFQDRTNHLKRNFETLQSLSNCLQKNWQYETVCYVLLVCAYFTFPISFTFSAFNLIDVSCCQDFLLVQRANLGRNSRYLRHALLLKKDGW